MVRSCATAVEAYHVFSLPESRRRGRGRRPVTLCARSCVPPLSPCAAQYLAVPLPSWEGAVNAMNAASRRIITRTDLAIGLSDSVVLKQRHLSRAGDRPAFVGPKWCRLLRPEPLIVRRQATPCPPTTTTTTNGTAPFARRVA